MKMWLFGKEVECFKPLRKVLDPNTLSKIEVDEKLILEGWTVEKIQDLLSFQGFLDPQYPNHVRTTSQILTFEGLNVIKIQEIKEYKQQLENNLIAANEGNLYTFFVDFSKNKPISIQNHLNDKTGIELDWIEEDLKATGTFIEKEENIYKFNTDYFHYKVTDKLEVVSVSWKESNAEISKIEWFENKVLVYIKEEIYEFSNDYFRWLTRIMDDNHFCWVNPFEQNEDERSFIRAGRYADGISDRWVEHPNIWDKLNINKESDKQFLRNLWQDDWKINGVYLSYENGRCVILGWRFLYVWEGLVLKEVLLPNEDAIHNLKIKEDEIIVNNNMSQTLLKNKPERVVDLIEGNAICILPRMTITALELHDHAIRRYEERVKDDYLCIMMDKMLTDIYEKGRVVEGAHTEKRRKVETGKYGYVISDTYVISVWDKTKQVNQPKKKVKKTCSIKNNKRLRHLDRMKHLFDRIEEGGLN